MEENRYIIMINSEVIAENMPIQDAILLIKAELEEFNKDGMMVSIKKMDNDNESFTKEENCYYD